jgi:hypothetical protein
MPVGFGYYGSPTYMLMKPKQQADDWVWIIDHTVQLEVEKCLVILGSAWAA